MGRQLDHGLMAVGARDYRVDPALQGERHVLDRFALAEPNALMVEINAGSAHLRRAQVEGHARAQTGLFKNQRDAASGQRVAVIPRIGFHISRRGENLPDFCRSQVIDRDQVFEGQLSLLTAKRKRSMYLFPNRYLRRLDKHLGAVLPEGLNVSRFGMPIQSRHALPIFIGDEISGLLDRLMKIVVDAGRFGSRRGDELIKLRLESLFRPGFDFNVGDYGDLFFVHWHFLALPSDWRFERKTEIISKRRPAIQTRRFAAPVRLTNNKVLTMSWLIFLALLLPGSQDPQFPPIGIIDFYGLRSISERQVRESLQIKEGDPSSVETKEAERRLESLPGVAEAHVARVCCDAGKAILFVGIREKGTPSLQFRPAPRGKVRLPQDVAQAEDDYQKARSDAILKGNSGEDDSRGHALSSDPAMRAVEERFITFAARDLKLLRDVLRHSADAEHRALAAQVIAYTANKQAIVNDLVEATRDPA